MSLIRDVFFGFGALVLSPLWGLRMIRSGKWRTDWRGRFGYVKVKSDTRPTVLIHGVSVGEINAIRELVVRLGERHGDNLRIVISTTTDTGFGRAMKLFGDRHEVVRYPFDFTFAARRFLGSVLPELVVLVELEVWPTFMEECGRMGIGVIVVNGRLSRRSYRGYRRIRGLVGGMFGGLTAVAAQNEEYAERFVDLGVASDGVSVTGTMKWDTAVIADEVEGAEEFCEAMGIDRGLPLIVCGSTGPGEEAWLVEALLGLRDGDGGRVQLLIAPRKPERGDEVAMLMGEPVRRSEHLDGTSYVAGEGQMFLVDTIGDLGKAYSLADVVVVGRSFCGLYGSDMMEPIGLGRPVVIGPETDDFASIMERLIEGDGIVQVNVIDEVRGAVMELLGTKRGRELAENGRRVILKEQGATDLHVALIEKTMGMSVGKEGSI